MPFRNSQKSNERPLALGSKVKKVFFFALLTALIGWIVFEPFYVRHHKPLIAAELAEAERQGPALIEQIGAPEGSRQTEPLETSVGGPNFKSKWHGIDNELHLVATWDVPGTPAQVGRWYVSRLPAQGWIATEAPSEYHSTWEREKWMLTVQHNEWWGGSDAHVRVRVRLYWNYGRTDVGRAGGG